MRKGMSLKSCPEHSERSYERPRHVHTSASLVKRTPLSGSGTRGQIRQIHEQPLNIGPRVIKACADEVRKMADRGKLFHEGGVQNSGPTIWQVSHTLCLAEQNYMTHKNGRFSLKFARQSGRVVMALFSGDPVHCVRWVRSCSSGCAKWVSKRGKRGGRCVAIDPLSSNTLPFDHPQEWSIFS